MPIKKATKKAKIELERALNREKRKAARNRAKLQAIEEMIRAGWRPKD